ncbi:MAG TPA: serine/threonine-protein kinase [Gemmatimonadaceae bacterium]|nr:serine/threonine-protein kinase [Gemmatimonadaceae bacterium]
MGTRAALQSALGGAYRFDRELSEGTSGGAGTFLATDLAVGRPVVLKVLSRDASASVSPDRFVTALDPIRSLTHPNLVALLGAGRVDAQLYYVTSYVHAEPLRAVLARSGKLPTSDVVSMLRDVGRALAHMHSRGVCHGDITPATLFQNGVSTLVADAGIARVLGQSPSPIYAAPDEPPTDHRADLYALGVVAYELLTGTPPFVARSAPQLASAHALEPPAPVTARRPATPPALAAVVTRLLMKNRDDRFQSAEELLAAIDAVRVTPAERASGPQTITPVHPRLPRQSGETPAEVDRKIRRRFMVASAILAVLIAGALLVTCPRPGN